MDRSRFLQQIRETAEWDILVIGGGATGLGTAVDAAHRGYSTLLLEQADFAKGTSSRSTKLVHGGVRYLAQGQISLVIEALKERGRLLQNAPHLVKQQAFIIPCYGWWPRIKYLSGLKIYDWLSGRFSFGKSRSLSRHKVLERLPGIAGNKLKGGVEYYDGQFDDSRLAINLAQTCAEQGGVPLNYMRVTGLLKSEGGKISGVKALDCESDEMYTIRARAVVNATGVFVDEILQMDKPSGRPLVRPSQGVHIVLDRTFLEGDRAMMIPETSDGRVLFAVPWHEHIVVGTTDTPLQAHSLEPEPLEEEIRFILDTAGRYLARVPRREDVLSIFAGLRPLAAPDSDTSSTKEISRSHKLMVSDTGLVTITGGKWTTFRKMAEDTVNKAAAAGGLKVVPCTTSNLKIHGYTPSADGQKDFLSAYGSDAAAIRSLVAQSPEWNEPLHEHFPYLKGQVIWAVRREMARTVEDILARRLRLLFLDAKASMEAAPSVAALMARELGRTDTWQKEQVSRFTELAGKYRP